MDATCNGAGFIKSMFHGFVVIALNLFLLVSEKPLFICFTFFSDFLTGHMINNRFFPHWSDIHGKLSISRSYLSAAFRTPLWLSSSTLWSATLMSMSRNPTSGFLMPIVSTYLLLRVPHGCMIGPSVRCITWHCYGTASVETCRKHLSRNAYFWQVALSSLKASTSVSIWSCNKHAPMDRCHLSLMAEKEEITNGMCQATCTQDGGVLTVVNEAQSAINA